MKLLWNCTIKFEISNIFSWWLTKVQLSISDTAQLTVLVHGVNESFKITKEILNLIIFKSAKKEQDIYNVVEFF